jgi:hypothetical protein
VAGIGRRIDACALRALLDELRHAERREWYGLNPAALQLQVKQQAVQR